MVEDTILTLHGGGKGTIQNKYKFTITYENNDVEEIYAEYFGTSLDNSNFMVFGNGDPELTPPVLIKVEAIRKIKATKL